jgi:predicted transcriptional regulator YdeE
METKIVDETSIILAGISFYGDPFDSSDAWSEENQIGRLWQRLMTYLERHQDSLQDDMQQGASYEVHIYGPETESKGLFEVFVGLRVSAVESVPFDLTVKVLPAATYAVFTLTGKAIIEDWEKEMTVWLEQEGYQEAYSYNFQYYDARFKGMDRIDDSQIDVYIPVEKAA